MNSPVKPADFLAVIPAPTDSTCTQLVKALIQFPTLVYRFIKWLVNVDGTITTGASQAICAGLQAIGCVTGGTTSTTTTDTTSTTSTTTVPTTTTTSTTTPAIDWTIRAHNTTGNGAIMSVQWKIGGVTQETTSSGTISSGAYHSMNPSGAGIGADSATCTGQGAFGLYAPVTVALNGGVGLTATVTIPGSVTRP